jgi:hypothetical protein
MLQLLLARGEARHARGGADAAMRREGASAGGDAGEGPGGRAPAGGGQARGPVCARALWLSALVSSLSALVVNLVGE